MRNPQDRAIAAALLLSIAGSVAFAAAFWTAAPVQAQGGALAVTFFGLALAMLGWSRWILPYEKVVDLRDTYPQPKAERKAEDAAAVEGVRDITRKTWLTRMLYGALGTLGLAALFPIGALGPPPGDAPYHTRWRRGSRMKKSDGTVLKASDMNVGAVETVFPEDAVGDYTSMAVVIKLPDGVGKDARDGFVVYSKACTHAGCPVALYRASDYHLICPCHQSSFDAAANGQRVQGPADRALPQLPIEVSSDGFLRATGDFPHSVGPGFWQSS